VDIYTSVSEKHFFLQQYDTQLFSTYCRIYYHRVVFRSHEGSANNSRINRGQECKLQILYIYIKYNLSYIPSMNLVPQMLVYIAVWKSTIFFNEDNNGCSKLTSLLVSHNSQATSLIFILRIKYRKLLFLADTSAVEDEK